MNNGGRRRVCVRGVPWRERNWQVGDTIHHEWWAATARKVRMVLRLTGKAWRLDNTIDEVIVGAVLSKFHRDTMTLPSQQLSTSFYDQCFPVSLTVDVVDTLGGLPVTAVANASVSGHPPVWAVAQWSMLGWAVETFLSKAASTDKCAAQPGE